MTDELTIIRVGTRIAIAGDIRTRANCDELKTHVAAAIEQLTCDKPELIIDVAGAGYLDSTALATFITIARKCMEVGASLVLEGVNEDLAEILRVTHVDEVLTHRGARVKKSRPAA